MKLNKFADFASKQLESHFQNNKKNTWKFTRNTEIFIILEK